MRAPTKGNHPCPILLEDGGDYINGCDFSTSIVEIPGKEETKEFSEIKNEYEITVAYHCPPLEKAIASGNAKIVIMEEQDTIRRAHEYHDLPIRISIKPSELKLGNNIEITPLIVSTTNFELPFDGDYMDEMYGWFNRNVFPIEKGQILGYGRTAEIKTFRLKGLSQIVKINKMNDDKNRWFLPFEIDLSSDECIYINVQKSIYENIQNIQSNQNELGAMVNSCIVYPAFYYIVQKMIVDMDDYQQSKWFTAIKNKINVVRTANSLELFEPNDSDRSDSDYVWELVSQLLGDETKQLPLMCEAFEKAGQYGTNEG